MAQGLVGVLTLSLLADRELDRVLKDGFIITDVVVGPQRRPAGELGAVCIRPDAVLMNSEVIPR